MRPRGEVREVLLGAFRRLIEERGLIVEGEIVDGITWREAAEASQVGFEAARRTVENMVQAGELERIGSRKAEGSQHWQGVYVPKIDLVEVTSLDDIVPRFITAWPHPIT